MSPHGPPVLQKTIGTILGTTGMRRMRMDLFLVTARDPLTGTTKVVSALCPGSELD